MGRIERIFFGVLCVLIIISFSAYSQNKRKPNIVIIMADDLGYGDISCYGSARVKTPNLDRMAKEGIRFSDFHSNGAVCSPTRAALLTGRYQQRSGISGVVTAKNHRDVGLAIDELTIADAMKKEGYKTAIFGKWHVGYPEKFNPVYQGFDEYIGFVSGNVDYHSHVDQEGFEDWWNGNQIKKEKGYSTDLITDHAVNFINRNAEEPFFLYIPHEAPHYPYQGRKSKAGRMIGGKPGKDFNNFGPDKNIEPLFEEMIEVMDEGIGNVINALKKNGIAENTLVFFCSDNGGAGKIADNGPLKGFKGSVWEGGHRVPAIAWWPETIKGGQENHQKILTMDFLPTAVDLAGGIIPDKLDGVSLKNLLLKNKKLKERDLFWQHGSQKAIRSGDWKLVLVKPDAVPVLFNLKTDIGEKNNVAEKHPALVKALFEKLKEWEQNVTKGVKRVA